MQVSLDARQIKPEGDSPSTSRAWSTAFGVNAETNREELVSLTPSSLKTLPIYAEYSPNMAPYYRSLKNVLQHIWVRDGILQKLLRVNEHLIPFGYQLIVLDGFRTLELQTELWEWFLEKIAAQKNLPQESAEVVRVAERFCSNPLRFSEADIGTHHLHYSGAAVDVSLTRVGSLEPVYMGGIFDDPSTISQIDFYELIEQPNASEFEARRNRRILYWAMITEGFVNLSSEWWHYEFGGRTWVETHGKENLLYATPPNIEEIT